MTRRTDQNDGREVEESVGERLALASGAPMWIECKGVNGQTRLAFSELMEHQRRFLSSSGRSAAFQPGCSSPWGTDVYRPGARRG